jgi:hypothetical protein
MGWCVAVFAEELGNLDALAEMSEVNSDDL